MSKHRNSCHDARQRRPMAAAGTRFTTRARASPALLSHPSPIVRRRLKVTHRFSRQIAATAALIQFLNEHDLVVPDELRQSLTAWEAEDTQAACRYAHTVRPFGMGSLTDSRPTPVFPHENQDYCNTVHEALIRNWCFWVSTADEEQQSRRGKRWYDLLKSFWG